MTDTQHNELDAVEGSLGQAAQMWDLCNAFMEELHVSHFQASRKRASLKHGP